MISSLGDEIWRTALAFVSLIGPSGVRALPLAAGINIVCHYKWHFFSSSLFSLLPGSLLILTDGVVVGIQIFVWAPN